MSRTSSSLSVVPPLDGAVLAAAARSAAEAARAEAEPASAIAAGVSRLWQGASGLYVSVFVLEHERLWLVAQRGYSILPDGFGIQRGVMGRAVRARRPQLVPDVSLDSDYVPALPAVRSELALPLRAEDGSVVGVLNVESEHELPADAARLVRPLTTELAPHATALHAGRTIDIASLARLFVYLGSLRDDDEIAALAAATLAKLLPVEASQLVLWDESGAPVERAAWHDESGRGPLALEEIEGARHLVDPTAVCQVLGARGTGALVWLPLRANAEDLGALLGVSESEIDLASSELETAALLAAHVAASLDAAVALRRERQSAETDPLTGILNRRGFEDRVEATLLEAASRRMPVSFMILDCDDFKEINERGGYEFGDALLVAVAEALEPALPAGAVAARLGGDEFVVMLPDAGADAAEAVGARIRAVLAEGLTDAGFLLRVSAGISTFPFDGATTTELLRAADQALYAAKRHGKDRIATFRDVVAPGAQLLASPAPAPGPERRGGVRSDGSVLAEIMEAVRALEREETVEGVCARLCKALVFVVGATGCMTSRISGEHLVDATEHTLRDVSLGGASAYRIADFPVTQAVLEEGEPRALSFLDGSIDPAEAFVLRELSMNALLMLPLRVHGTPWGLVELYEMRLRQFTEDDVAVAHFLVEHAERRLEVVDRGDQPSLPRDIYELPPGGRSPRSF